MKKTIMLTFLMLFMSLIAQTVSQSSAKGGVVQYDSITVMKEFKHKKKIADSINLVKSIYAALEYVKVEPVIETEVLYKHVKGTVYHADPNQTDDTPFLTADNSVIDNSVVNKLRWVALSRDLLNRRFTDPWGRKHFWNGKIKLGDTIWVDYDNKNLWRITHTPFKHLNHRYDSIVNSRQDAYYEKLKDKYEQIKGYWIVHDIMGDRYPMMKKNGQYILDANGKKQYVNIYKAIDFLQHPEIGMMDSWDRHITISKRTVRYITSNQILMASN